ncbi:MAG: PQQ-binding-like beta-propeller repeat protein, partial [Synergistaceae bacterium]|nr:PQQ-binding-like beta-propeller repeat protein [Synergistaceae bacterium]
MHEIKNRVFSMLSLLSLLLFFAVLPATEATGWQGVLHWSYDALSSVSGSPAVAGDKILIGDDTGKLHALDRNTGRSLWIFDTKATIN